MTAKAQGVTLDYAEHWPQLTAIDGDVRFEGARMSIDVQKGQYFDAPLSATKVGDRQSARAHPVAQHLRRGLGADPDFLRFIDESPVAGWIEHFTDGAEATGSGKLALKLDLPLGKPADNHIAGEYTFASNRVKLAGGVPVLNHLNGTLAFNGHAVQRIRGSPPRFWAARRTSPSAATTGICASPGKGSADAAQAAGRISAAAAGAARQRQRPTGNSRSSPGARATTWSADSNLRGVTIDLPPPIGKRRRPRRSSLEVERRAGDGRARYGRCALRAHRATDAPAPARRYGAQAWSGACSRSAAPAASPTGPGCGCAGGSMR